MIGQAQPLMPVVLMYVRRNIESMDIESGNPRLFWASQERTRTRKTRNWDFVICAQIIPIRATLGSGNRTTVPVQELQQRVPP